MDNKDTLSSADAMPEMGGIFMEYPSLDEVKSFVRDLPFKQRLTILSQGFHRGAAAVYCYNLKEFVTALSKREFDNPAGGVRVLDFDEVIPWLCNVIGDKILSDAVQKIVQDATTMAEATDRTRLIVFIRVEQYNEVLDVLTEEERAELGGSHA